MEKKVQSDEPDFKYSVVSAEPPVSGASNLDDYYLRLVSFQIGESEVQVINGQPGADLPPPLCLQDRLCLADQQHIQQRGDRP